MAEIALIDTTMRDGNQSLWGATGLNTAMMATIAPTVDRVGFSAVDFITSTHMAVAVRYLKENPWERIRVMRALMPKTPLSFLTTGMRFISWEMASAELMELAFSLLVRDGIRRFAVMDPMNDAAAMIAMARLSRKVGAPQVVAALCYTVSPLHDDAYFVTKAAQLAVSREFDALYLKDPGGLLTPERARTLLPALKAAIAALPLELHSHCNIGLAPFSYLAGAESGVARLHVAVRPLANGTSQPAAEQVVANLRDLGHVVDIDDEALAQMSAYFAALAQNEGLETGKPQDFDRSYFRHQMPGGMLTTLKRQLNEMKRGDLLGKALEEVERVRAELGYPIMVTPFSQIVGAQAVMNVISDERYARLPDEVIRYALGRFGAPAAPLDPKVLDRVHSSARAKELQQEPGMASLSELRARLGRDLPDEEFLLRAVMPAEQVDAMKAAGEMRLDYDPQTKPVLRLLKDLAARKGYGEIVVEKPGLRLELRGRRDGGAHAARIG
jgi:oxaloacetate decarboxylase alpha subunit